MAEAPLPAPPKTGFPFRRAALAVWAVAIAIAGFLRIGTIAWAIGGLGFLVIVFTYFQFHRPSRWRLAATSSTWSSSRASSRSSSRSYRCP